MRGRLGIAAAALLAAVGAGANIHTLAHTPDAVAQREAARPASTKRITPSVRANAKHYRKTGPGWSTRQVQRMAAKKRNIARNRAHHRGRK